MGLAAFRTMEEGDTLNHASTSPAPSPKPTALVTGGPSLAPEFDELSLVRTHFLLFKVDLDEPLISRLHGYDRKQRSEFFHSRLKTLFNRQYQSIYLYCIRIHVLHHCCHLHHHPHGNKLSVYKYIYMKGVGAGVKGWGLLWQDPHLLLIRHVDVGLPGGLPSASQPRAHGRRWLLPQGQWWPQSRALRCSRRRDRGGLAGASDSPCPPLSVGGFDPPMPSTTTPSGAV